MKRRGAIPSLAPVIIYSGIIFAFSAMSDPPAPEFGIKLGDKINHFGAFAIMMLLAMRGAVYLRPDRGTAYLYWIAFAYCSLYGATDELHQAFVPNRAAEIPDLIADVLGAAMAGLAVIATRRTRMTRWVVGAAIHPKPETVSA